MIRTKFHYGYNYPNGTIVRLRNSKVHKKRRFVFLAIIKEEKALLWRPGPTERSQFYLLVNPNKVVKVKEKINAEIKTSEINETSEGESS